VKDIQENETVPKASHNRNSDVIINVIQHDNKDLGNKKQPQRYMSLLHTNRVTQDDKMISQHILNENHEDEYFDNDDDIQLSIKKMHSMKLT
jgi:hypothetical protein